MCLFYLLSIAVVLSTSNTLFYFLRLNCRWFSFKQTKYWRHKIWKKSCAIKEYLKIYTMYMVLSRTNTWPSSRRRIIWNFSFEIICRVLAPAFEKSILNCNSDHWVISFWVPNPFHIKMNSTVTRFKRQFQNGVKLFFFVTYKQF